MIEVLLLLPDCCTNQFLRESVIPMPQEYLFEIEEVPGGCIMKHRLLSFYSPFMVAELVVQQRPF